MVKPCKDIQVKYIYCVQDSSLFPGFYNSVLFNEGLLNDAISYYGDPDHDYDLTDVDGYCKAVCKKIVDDVYSNLVDDVIKSIKFAYVVSPEYYNFDTDKLNLELELDRDALEVYIFKTNAEEFDVYLAENFTSYDGFISYIANNLHEFRNQYLTEGKSGRALDIMLDFYLLSHLGELSYKFSDIAADTIQDFIEQV